MNCRICGRETDEDVTCLCQPDPKPLNSFLRRAVSDCVNGSSGDFSAYAAGIRAAAGDADEDRGGWNGKLYDRPCRSCGRESLHLTDGWCEQCLSHQPANEPAYLATERERLRQTAEILRGLGYEDRAVWYEEEAKRA